MTLSGNGSAGDSPASPAGADEPTPGDVRVMVVAGSRLHREGLALRLSAEPGVVLIGSSGSIRAARPAAASGAVDVVLVDVGPTVENRAELAAMARAAPRVCFIALMGSSSDADVVAWAEAGASGFLDCVTASHELRDVLRAAMRGEVLCTPRIAGALLRGLRALARDSRPTDAAARLTERERHVLQLVGRGLSNKEIALELGLRVATVKNHVHSIFEKLEVRSRAMAVTAALTLDTEADSSTSTSGSA